MPVPLNDWCIFHHLDYHRWWYEFKCIHTNNIWIIWHFVGIISILLLENTKRETRKSKDAFITASKPAGMFCHCFSNVLIFIIVLSSFHFFISLLFFSVAAAAFSFCWCYLLFVCSVSRHLKNLFFFLHFHSCHAIHIDDSADIVVHWNFLILIIDAPAVLYGVEIGIFFSSIE